MKMSEFKKAIKESVREVFQEEMKELLLEAVRGSKGSINETRSIPSHNPMDNIKSQLDMNLMNRYKDEMDEEFSFTSKNITPSQDFNIDVVNGTLPQGGVDLSQIMNLI